MIITDQAEYRASDAVSFSKIKVFEKRPSLYRKQYILKTTRAKADTKAQRIGSAGHCLILEGPIAFAERYAVKPETYESDKGARPWNANAKLCEAWELNQEALGRVVLPRADSELLFPMREAFLSNPDAVALVSAGTPELAIRRPLPSLGIELQGRLDWWNPDAGVVLDLKTIESLDDRGREIERRGYFRQLAWYRNLAAEEFGAVDVRCAIVWVEKTDPFECAVEYLRGDLLDRGDAINAANLVKLAEAIRTNTWGGNPPTREVGPSVELQLSMASEIDACA